MTPSQRELAEYVARWAGYVPIKLSYDHEPLWSDYEDLAINAYSILASEFLAWQAQEELIEMVGFQEAANKVQATMNVLGCTRIEATFRALRAAKGGE